MNDALLDTVISGALDDAWQLGERAVVGPEQIHWIMTRDMYDYIVSDTQGQFKHIEFCEKLDGERYARFYGLDVYIMLKGDPMRRTQIFPVFCHAGHLDSLEWMQDGEYLTWDGDLFVRENDQIREAQFEISRDVVTARTEYEERVEVEDDFVGDPPRIAHYVQDAIDHLAVTAVEPIAEIQDGFRTEALYFDEFVNVANGAQDAAVAAATVADTVRMTAVEAETAADRAWDATVDFTPRYAFVNNGGIRVDNIRAATITTDNVQTNLDALDGWTAVEPNNTYATTTTTNTWNMDYGHIYAPTWTITIGEDGEYHIRSVEADKPVKEKEIKRSKKLDDFIDQYAPKK